ncbi:GNAT family N-acetyltransferase [Paenibacillus sp. N1-5-1-14]|nr:GNAT family N-acetyltransferase [Paenibacillus radicibacter]MCR8642668.1 GNAT family N-acetyltransferase [Paenibacillus radicibacter]
MSDLTMRYAQIEDLPAIVEIYNSTIAGRMVTADTQPVTVESRLPWFHAHTNDLRPLWVGEIEGQICGWISFQSFYGRPAYLGTVEISIYVSEQFRGQGLGRRFLEFTISACATLDVHTILGFIFGHNEPSLKLFEKYGFERWGHFPRVAVLDSVERDLVIVGKRVG